LSSQGFNGIVTISDPCRCDYIVAWGTNGPNCKICTPPRQIQYFNGNPYCVNPPECEALETTSDTNAIRLAKVQQVYQRLVFPTALLIITGQQNVNDLFAPTAKGRVSPVGSFDDFTSIEEYFYGLGAAGTHILSVNVKKLAVLGNEVAVWVDIFFDNATNGGTPAHNLTQTGFFTFDNNNLITSVDLDLLNLGWALDGDSATNATTRDNSINKICTSLTVSPGFCPPSTDPAGFYSSFADCVTFMHNITYGTFAHANSNTVVCRSIHTLLTAFRPLVHCPHVGKTGGMKCVDTEYITFYEEDF